MMIIFIAIDPVELQPFKQNISVAFCLEAICPVKISNNKTAHNAILHAYYLFTYTKNKKPFFSSIENPFF
jgi:hypothetical protein